MIRISAVIMAAGTSSRMGENKLLIKLGGKLVAEHLMSIYPHELFHKGVAVYSDESVGSIFHNAGLQTILNDSGDEKCTTIRLGTEACLDSDGLMFFVADQPFINAEIISWLINDFKANKDKIIVPVCEGKNRNPVIFPKSVFDELLRLKGGSWRT